MPDHIDYRELHDLRIAAVFRSSPETLQAWAWAVSSACEVDHLLKELGWSEVDRIQALHRLAQAVMSAAPNGPEEASLP